MRITTTVKPPLASIVELDHHDLLAGRILCDDITVLYDGDPARRAGALTLATMTKVAAALRVALAL